MSLLYLALKAFMFGIAVAAPIGPMGILCMRRTLVQGWKYGLMTATGIAASDAIYSAVAALGLHGLTHFIWAHEPLFHLIAGVFLMCFGFKIFLSPPVTKTADNVSDQISLPYAFGSAVLMTLTNPLTLLFFVTVFTALTPPSGFDNFSSLVTVSGVFTGSFSWALGIVVSVSLFRHVISDRKLLLIDRLTGAFLVIFGISEIWQYWQLQGHAHLLF